MTTNDPAGETQRAAAGYLREFFRLFGWGDLMTFMIILLVGSIVTHETRGFESASPYATAFYYALTNIAQVVAPILAVTVAIGLWLARRSTRPDSLVKGVLLLFLVLAISLLLLPFAESIYEQTGVWQGGATVLILLALWGIVLVVRPLVEMSNLK